MRAAGRSLDLKKHMKTKTTLITLAALLGAGMSAMAQDGPPPGPRGPKGPPPPEVIREFDKDGDGKLNEEELAAMKEAHKARREARRKAMLEKYDTDKDGKLSDEEKAAMKAAKKKELLEKYDKDGDGKLNEEERKAAIEAGDLPRRGPRGPRPDGPPPAPEEEP
jgi:hypothetical protein